MSGRSSRSSSSPIQRPSRNNQNDAPTCERLSAIEQKLSSLPAIEAKIDSSVAKIDLLIEMIAKSGSGTPTKSIQTRTKSDQPARGRSGTVHSLSPPPSPRPLPSVEMEASSDSSDDDGDDPYALGLATDQDGKSATSVLVESDAGMINPINRIAGAILFGLVIAPCLSSSAFRYSVRFRMTWDLAVVMPLLVYLSIVMPFRLTFANEASQFSSVYWFEFLIDMLFIFDIIFNFRTGYIVDEGTYVEGPGGEEIQKVEYDRSRVAINYIKSWFILDVVSGIPFALLELLTSNDSGDSPLKSAKVFKLLRFLKLGRLLKLDKILSNLDQDTLDVIEDFFQDGTTRSAMMMLKLIFCLAYVAHLMACGLVLVGKVGDSAGVDSWLAHEIRGPFISEDTTGINGGGAVYSIYIASFYFSLTTMTSVGYGDIITRYALRVHCTIEHLHDDFFFFAYLVILRLPRQTLSLRNNLERLYVISLEFMGAIIFATVIAAITSVVSSMDMNARKTAEELDAVASFVAMRHFPTMLARKIRRHFRHFYSRKSAIDETKIFSELSTTLREKVSEYLVTEMLGERSFFTGVSKALWPRLLPLLRPMNFVRKEFVCTRGIASTEMYVVISGRFVGKLQVGDQERVRNIIKGDSVNTLHVLGIWSKCVESVEAITTGETYAISKRDFMSLYSSDSKHALLETLQRREVRKYKMEPIEGSEWGRPLYFTHFSCVEFSLMQLSGSFLPIGEMNFMNALSEVRMWAVVELVNIATGAPVNDIWRHTTAPRRLDLVDGQGIGKLSYDDSGVFDTVRWHDISYPFRQAALRVSLYVYDRKGASFLVGRGVLSLEEINNTTASESKQRGPSNKLVPTTNDSFIVPHLRKEDELDTWLSLTSVKPESHFSSFKSVPSFKTVGLAVGSFKEKGGFVGTSLDGPRTRSRVSTLDRDIERPIGDELHLRVSARPPVSNKVEAAVPSPLLLTTEEKKRRSKLDSSLSRGASKLTIGELNSAIC